MKSETESGGRNEKISKDNGCIIVWIHAWVIRLILWGRTKDRTHYCTMDDNWILYTIFHGASLER